MFFFDNSSFLAWFILYDMIKYHIILSNKTGNKEMSIVLFGGEKGGTGKTTLATNMAALLALQGKDVLLLGCSPGGSRDCTPDRLCAEIRQGIGFPGARSGCSI